MLNHAVTFTGCRFQFFAIQDHARLRGCTESLCPRCNLWAARLTLGRSVPSMVARKSWVRGSLVEFTRSWAISSQRASRCSDVVQPIASRCLCHLHSLEHSIAAQVQLQFRRGLQSRLQGARGYPESLSSDLHYFAQRAFVTNQPPMASPPRPRSPPPLLPRFFLRAWRPRWKPGHD